MDRSQVLPMLEPPMILWTLRYWACCHFHHPESIAVLWIYICLYRCGSAALGGGLAVYVYWEGGRKEERMRVRQRLMVRTLGMIVARSLSMPQIMIAPARETMCASYLYAPLVQSRAQRRRHLSEHPPSKSKVVLSRPVPRSKSEVAKSGRRKARERVKAWSVRNTNLDFHSVFSPPRHPAKTSRSSRQFKIQASTVDLQSDAGETSVLVGSIFY